MAVKLYMDVHVPRPITDQLRRREVDVLTAEDDDAESFADDALLERSTELGPSGNMSPTLQQMLKKGFKLEVKARMARNDSTIGASAAIGYNNEWRRDIWRHWN